MSDAVLVNNGGIGANAPVVRAKVCAGMDYLGVALDERRNAGGAHSIAADEEVGAVRHVRRVLAKSATEETA